jgi:hypothetical protein
MNFILAVFSLSIQKGVVGISTGWWQRFGGSICSDDENSIGSTDDARCPAEKKQTGWDWTSPT